MEERQQGVAGKNGGRLSMAGMGRARGVPNRATRTIKAMYLQALDKAGGWKFFYKLATGSAEDRRVFATMGARLFPLEVNGHMDQGLVVKIIRQGSEEKIVRLAGSAERALPSHGTCSPMTDESDAPMREPIEGEIVNDPEAK